MGMSVNTNVAAMNAYRNLSVTNNSMSKSLERLSSGFRINRAADDAAGLAISEGLRSQIGGLTQAVRNTQDGVSVVQTAEGALNETTSILQRMRDLSVQASNSGSLNSDATASIQKEIGQLKEELTRISNTTTFNGTKLLDGSFNKAFQVGANAGETISVAVGTPGKGMDALGLGVSGVDVTGTSGPAGVVTGAISDDQGAPTAGKSVVAGDYSTAATLATNFAALKGTLSYNGKSLDLATVDYTGASTAANYLAKVQTALDGAFGAGAITAATTGTASIDFTGAVPAANSTAADAAALTPTWSKQSGATAAITAIDAAIKTVSSTRADLGAKQNRFEHTINNLNTAIENTTASESRIRDTDMASEMTKFTRSQVLTQAGTSMLAQANQSTQSILKLLG
jgi:flagellin-like hook-associated protein FlgL